MQKKCPFPLNRGFPFNRGRKYRKSSIKFKPLRGRGGGAHLFQARLRRAYLRGGLFTLEQTMVSVLPEKPQVPEDWSSCSRGSESNPNFQLGNKKSQISPRLQSTVVIYQYSL